MNASIRALVGAAGVVFVAVVLLADAPATARSSGAPTIATLPIPGHRPFVRIARDVVDLVAELDPSIVAGAGLFDDAVRVPGFSPARVEALVRRIDHDLDDLHDLPWRTWSVDEQIDVRLVYATAETLRHQLTRERMFEHRPAQWLEPVGNNLLALASYAPDRPELQDRVLALVPPMLAEIPAVATRPTRRDVETARRLTDALHTVAVQRGATAAAEALLAYGSSLDGLHPTVEYTVVGAADYAWRFEHTLLLPWTPQELLARAQADLTTVDARIAALPPRPDPVPPGEDMIEMARTLTRERLLGLYDVIEEANRAATVRGGWVTIPGTVGPIHARETPDALVPLTGDGGSMNPPPTFATSNIGYWNVEHFNPGWTEAERLGMVTNALGFLSNGMGPYAAHEGFPGHHLQLSLARLNPDPLRSILPDPVQNEGWALYAEEVFFRHGGLDPAAERSILGSYRHRIRRVVYDVHIETGAWDLQRAADYKYNAEPGQGAIDEELMRSIQWPTQLICYYAGRAQIVQLREDYARKMGAQYDERAFHDQLLAAGSIPITLIRAGLLGEAVPDFPTVP